MYDMVS